MLDILGFNEMSGNIKKRITDKATFNEAYDYEFNEMKNQNRKLILITLIPLVDSLGSYVDKGDAKDIDFDKMYEEIVRVEK